MENTNESALKLFQKIGDRFGVVVQEKKLTYDDVYEVVLYMCMHTTPKFMFELCMIWQAIIMFELLNFADLMKLANDFWHCTGDDNIRTNFLKRYPTEDLANDYILRTNGDITFMDSFYEKNLAVPLYRSSS